MTGPRKFGMGVGALMLACGSFAWSPGPGAPTDPDRRAADRTGVSSKLSRRVSIQLSDRRLADAVALVEHVSGLRLEPLWQDSRHEEGLDRETVISITVEQATIQTLLEGLMERSDPGLGGGATWQVSRTGTIQIGPRSRLNAFKRIEVYDVRDLIHLVPDHRRGPTIDLSQALRGDGIPISRTDDGGDWSTAVKEPRDRAADLADLIRELVEPDQWIENGGTGGSIRVHERMLIVSAPGYLHRAIAGHR